MPIRLGDLLVLKGVITEQEKQQILGAQVGRARPFGALAEEMFGVSPEDIEEAWGQQYAHLAERLNPATATAHPMTRSFIDRRQAWQFRVVPIRFDGTELVCVTTPEDLARAMRFVGWAIDRPVRFAICDEEKMLAGLERLYPMRAAATGVTETVARLAAS
ncbi:MAG: hypothetical protein R3B57_00730 [Phycisphaerales bacterium]